MLPSKELLSEILKKELERHDSAFVEVTDVGISNNVVHINYKNTHGFIRLFIINIYELAHKCKEWAFHNYHFVLASRVYKGSSVVIEETIGTGMGGGKRMVQQFIETTEPEAIFKACEYILKQLSNK